MQIELCKSTLRRSEHRHRRLLKRGHAAGGEVDVPAASLHLIYHFNEESPDAWQRTKFKHFFLVIIRLKYTYCPQPTVGSTFFLRSRPVTIKMQSSSRSF
ncbi:MAG TPA: hypothetical protein VGB55_10280, partial [Tepidisphaeraceae bacterium]